MNTTIETTTVIAPAYGHIKELVSVGTIELIDITSLSWEDIVWERFAIDCRPGCSVLSRTVSKRKVVAARPGDEWFAVGGPEGITECWTLICVERDSGGALFKETHHYRAIGHGSFNTERFVKFSW